MSGLCAEFLDERAVVRALGHLRSAGVEAVDAYTPWPCVAVEEALGVPRSRIPVWTLIGALIGGVGMYGLQWWIDVVNYRLDVGGRPPHSAVAFVPLTFELTILCGGFATFFGWMWYCGAPRLYDRVDEIEGFGRSTIDRFFVTVDGADPRFDPDRVARILESAGAVTVRALPEGRTS